jgi:hypothetical protein
VADDDDWPALVEVGHVVLPGGQQALVGDLGGGVTSAGVPFFVRWRQIGAQTWQTWEKREACSTAMNR